MPVRHLNYSFGIIFFFKFLSIMDPPESKFSFPGASSVVLAKINHRFHENSILLKKRTKPFLSG